MQEVEVVPVVLTGTAIRLEPLSLVHVAGFTRHMNGDLLRFFGGIVPTDYTPEGIRTYVERRLAQPNTLSFAMVRVATGEAVGHSSFMNIRPRDRVLEIGSTWISAEFHGTRVNPEAKYLMLSHAFDSLGCYRVELKTDERNLQSQRAIEKLGAVKEGILRKHLIASDGYHRNSVMYSIIDDEWPAVKLKLEDRLRP